VQHVERRREIRTTTEATASRRRQKKAGHGANPDGKSQSETIFADGTIIKNSVALIAEPAKTTGHEKGTVWREMQTTPPEITAAQVRIEFLGHRPKRVMPQRVRRAQNRWCEVSRK